MVLRQPLLPGLQYHHCNGSSDKTGALGNLPFVQLGLSVLESGGDSHGRWSH
jgi:hypothetical protein